MLEILLGDRFMLGLGRGLAKKEYEAFGVPMSEARERFDTSAELILEILETGVAEYDTEHFKQSRVEASSSSANFAWAAARRVGIYSVGTSVGS